ncbi:MAG TPA: hypothetical protein VN723_15865 [Rhizomicrobium sp.]|nr:hypothetical protein [Rhizomicrobium sp.]
MPRSSLQRDQDAIRHRVSSSWQVGWGDRISSDIDATDIVRLVQPGVTWTRRSVRQQPFGRRCLKPATRQGSKKHKQRT